jgi:aspartyl-tRNA(Asn)/glutamyl-tRNA(Gln) amidotransferase subunit A
MSMSDAWHTMTALELGRGVESGTIDPVALTDHFLARIEEVDTERSIYIRPMPERARAEADAARDRARRGLRRGPLDGVPISWKDLYDAAGVPTTGGTKLFTDQPPPDRDCLVLARATHAGSICLGKTNLPEFAFSALGINPHYGTPANAFDDRNRRLPGGSSSGAALSVARGLAAAGIGSDTGGSVRVPAAWSGLVGLKTTAGALPLDGVLPLVRALDTAGPLTRDVADAAALFSIMADLPQFDVDGFDVSRATFLLPKYLWSDLDADVAAVLDTALDRLGKAGARLEHVDIPEFEAVTDVFVGVGDLFSATAYAEWRDAIDARPHLVYPGILRRLKLAEGLSAVDFAASYLRIEDLTRSYYRRVADATAVLCPTTVLVPPMFETMESDPDAYAAAQRRIPRNTRVGNLMRLCGVSLPAGLADGLPVSLQVYGLPDTDRNLLVISSAIERALKAGV